jgi:eukaryotic-like serine/threonine-protein kinase
MPEPGEIIDGRYRVISRVGSGGMADVYCVEDEQLGRRVALKMLHRRFAEDQEFVERFRREASSAAALNHPNVVGVFDRGEWDGTYYIAMELLEGRNLKQVVRDHGALDPALAVDIVLQILKAARFAHRRGVVHRDIKPHNVIVDEEGRAKVTDFGIARAGASDMTQTGSIMGTAQYLSPEQAQGLAVTAASDLYAIGIILYELLTGRVPFDGETAVSIALQQVTAEPIPPSQLNPAVPAALDAIVLCALAKDPAQRFADADAFIAALEEVRAAGYADAGATTAFAPPAYAAGVGAVAAVAPAAVAEEVYYGPPVAPGPDGPGDQRGGRRWWWVAALVVLLLGGGAAAVIASSGGKSATKVLVPRVVGAQQAAATATLQAAGFRPASLTVIYPKPPGTVVNENPAGGTMAAKGSTVTITVSQGPGSNAVPDVGGLDEHSATAQLRAAGFRVRRVMRPSSTAPAGSAIGTSPPAGSPAENGFPVVLFVSSGPPQVTVPQVIGETENAAQQVLQANGLKASTQPQPSDQPSGTVLAQTPAAGSSAARDSTVVLTVASAQPKVAVPNLVGVGPYRAGQALRRAGLTEQTVTQTVSDPTQNGHVVGQSPAAGTKVKKGSAVKVVVGQYQPPTTPTTTTSPPPTTTATTTTSSLATPPPAAPPAG